MYTYLRGNPTIFQNGHQYFITDCCNYKKLYNNLADIPALIKNVEEGSYGTPPTIMSIKDMSTAKNKMTINQQNTADENHSGGGPGGGGPLEVQGLITA